MIVLIFGGVELIRSGKMPDFYEAEWKFYGNHFGGVESLRNRNMHILYYKYTLYLFLGFLT